jgi:hypothetical protein
MKETGMRSSGLEFRISIDSLDKIRKNYSAWGLKNSEFARCMLFPFRENTRS